MIWNVLMGAVVLLVLILFWMLYREIGLINRQLQQLIHEKRQPFIRQSSPFPVNRQLVRNVNNVLQQIEQITVEKIHSELARKQLISNVSHDLRTPLTSLLGYINMLKTDSSLSTEEKIAYINVIERKAEALYELIEHFFELSRLEAGDEPLQQERVNVTETVRQQLFAYYQDFQQRELEPQLDLPEQDLFALADSRALQRVITNLITNSLRYGSAGDRFGVRVWEEKGRIWVEVWDNGQGLQQDELERVFQRAYRTAEGSGKDLSGNGLGLHIVKKLIERMGGTIGVQSVPYVRTTFTFHLPQETNEES